MNNPEQIINRVLSLTDNLYLTFSNTNIITTHYQNLENISQELTSIYENLTASTSYIKGIIDEINRKIATTAAASLAISLFSDNGDNEENNSWIGELCDSMLSNFADDLLDDSIRDYIKHNIQDQNGLQNLYNSLVSIELTINIKINQMALLLSV